MKKLLLAGVAAVFLLGCNEVVEPCVDHDNGAPFCNGNTVVTCHNGEIDAESITCPNGCKNGECIK
ncbi:MAG: hypothetical protein II767_09730 [Proteobacteria bacterium]|nr:hypothetical protein [Pseudomonadota bacterium]